MEHSNPAWTTRSLAGVRIRNLINFRNVRWTAVSSHLQIWALSKKPEAILPNILLPSKELLPRLQIAKDLRRIVFIGRLEPNQKRPHFMLEVAKSLDFPVLIIGEGPAKESLQRESKKRSLNISFRGFVTNPWSLVEDGDLLVVPSAWEGDGLVVVEGLQKNAPMLVSDIADFRRFNFPSEMYCKDVQEFCSNIARYKNSLSKLQVPEKIQGEILNTRESSRVGDLWEDFINS